MSTEAPRNPEGFTEDELWASLDGQIGVERASTLIELVNMMAERSAYEQALPLIDAAVEAMVDADNEQVLAKVLSTRGAVLFSLERFEDSGEEHLKAARLYERYDSLSDTFSAYFNASWSFEAAQVLDRALENAEVALTVASQLDEPIYSARAHEQRADVLQKLDRPKNEVLETLAHARQAFREIPDAHAVLRLDVRVAHMFTDMGEYESAYNLFRDCQAVAETLDEYQAAHLNFMLGRVLRLQGKADEAWQRLQQPLQFNLERQLVRELGATYFELAQCKARTDDYTEALSLAVKARAHFDMAGADGGVRDVDESRAVWLHITERYDEAAAINQLLMETTSGWFRFKSRARMADNYRCKGDLERALELATPESEGEREFVGWGGWFWREGVRAWTYELMKMQDEAWEIARRCLEMDLSAASSYTRAKLYELMGDSYFMGDEPDEHAAHNWWSRAVAFYLSADAISDARRLSAEFIPDSAEEQVQ